MKHKHYNEIVAWAGGAKIQYRYADKQAPYIWEPLPTKTPAWREDYEYQVEPKPNNNCLRYVYSENNEDSVRFDYLRKENVKFTFDGETNELISVEMIK